MKLRGVLASLLVVVLMSGFSAPLAGARQRDTNHQKNDQRNLAAGHKLDIAWPGTLSMGVWESIDDISSSGRSRPAAAAVDGKIYLFGGEVDTGYENTVEMFDPATGVWVDMTGLMPKAAYNICAAVIGADVYIPGGYGSPGTALTNLQVYHVATDTWETVATDPVPVAVYGNACAVADDKLYTYGGLTGSAYLKSAYVYDPAAPAGSRWTELAEMTYARAWLAGVAIDDRIYAVGGYASPIVDLSYVEAYNPGDASWHTVTKLNTARGGPGAMFQGDTLIVCGGGWNTYLNTCESYDTTQGYAGAWETMSQTMNTGRRTYGYASLPEALYAVAGFHAPDLLTSAERLRQESRIFLPLVLR